MIFNTSKEVLPTKSLSSSFFLFGGERWVQYAEVVLIYAHSGRKVEMKKKNDKIKIK